MKPRGKVAGLAILLAFVPPGAGWSTTVTVSPGPGTPLQDAINAAAPGTKLLLQPGTFSEAVVIDKALTLTAVTDTAATIIDASSTDASFAVDIRADNVRLKGFHRSTPYGPLYVSGGTSGLIHIGANTGIALSRLVAWGPCQPTVTALVLDGTLGLSASNSSFRACYYSVLGPPPGNGARFSNIPAGSRIRLQDGEVRGGEDGLVIQDSGVGAAGLGKGGIQIVRPEISGSNSGLVVTNSSGIVVKGGERVVRGGFPPGEFRVLVNGITGPSIGGTSLSLDGTSQLNRFYRIFLDGTVSDSGIGNCGDDIGYGSPDEKTLASCS